MQSVLHDLGGSAAERADIAACRASLRHGSRSFHAASLLLPRTVRDSATALYAFCRLADDAVDEETGGPSERAASVAALAGRLDAAYAGLPFDLAPDRAFATVVARHRIPRTIPNALLEGFAWDAEGRRYETLADLHDYAARVAGTVGVMMAMLMGVREPDALARACDLGIAMQLTNIARDVGEDARAGRLFLPLAWLREAGITPDAFLADPRFTPALGRIVLRLLASADFLYERGSRGIGALPLACRPGIDAARRLYADIGQAVARAEGDSVSARARVSSARKLAGIARSLGAAVGSWPQESAAPLAAAAFLVASAAAASPAFSGRRTRTYDERIAWVVELMGRVQGEGAAFREG